jgi:hypothetical protein
LKFIRLLLRFLVLVVTLAAILVGLAFVPAVQTWLAEREIGQQSGWQVAIGSLSARFGKVDITDLHLEYNGAVLTLPSAQAALPLQAALWDHKFLVQGLAAKGWTLDLSHVPALADAWARAGVTAASGAAVQTSAPSVANSPLPVIIQILRGLLNGGNLPWDLSLDAVDLDGDVMVTVLQGREPVKVHVTIKGGGLAPGREGNFAINAGGVGLDSENQPVNVSGEGHLNVAMASFRVLNRVEIETNLTVSGGSLPNAVAMSAEVAADRVTHEETGTLELGGGDHKFAVLRGQYSGAHHQLEGTWKIDVHDADLAPFLPDRHLPSLATAGEGDFAADAALTQLHARGRLMTVASHLGIVVPALDHLGQLTLDARFDLTRRGESLEVGQLSISLAGGKPVLTVQSIQPFSVDEKTWDLAVADPQRDWLNGSVQGFPLAWLSGLADGVAFTSGDLAGEFTAQAANGGFHLRAQAPFTARGVSVQDGPYELGRDLDLSWSLLADYAHEGWQIQAAPLTVSRAGQRLATVDATASRPAEPTHPAAITATWSADLQAMAAQPAASTARWIVGRTASGDFSATFGAPAKLEGKLAVMGHDAAHSITASFSAERDETNQVTFHAPLKIALGSSVSDVTVEGLWIKQESGGGINLTVSGENVALEHLQLLIAPLLANREASPSNQGRDVAPFWGNWAGPVSFSFDRLRVGQQEIKNVRATLDVAAGSIRLENGLFALPNKGYAKAEGSLSFDPAAKEPYLIKGTASFGEVDARSLLPTAAQGSEPMVEGKFSIAGTLTGTGTTAADLLAHLQEEFRLTSRGGVFRLLKTSVSGVAPEKETPMADALSSAGSLVGSIFGRKENPFDSGEIHLSKNTDAVMNFTYRAAEILYDEFSFTAIRGSDRTFHIVDLALTAPEEHLTGSGQVTEVEGQPLRAQPLSLDLELGVRKGAADFLKAAGLLTSRQDQLGYTLLNQSIHLGGTLEHIDASQWHDLLTAAAKPQPAAGKKAAAAAGK